jgi:hypothetical protein
MVVVIGRFCWGYDVVWFYFGMLRCNFIILRSKEKKNAQVVAKIPYYQLPMDIIFFAKKVEIALGRGTVLFSNFSSQKVEECDGVANAHVNFLESTTTGRFRFLSFYFLMDEIPYAIIQQTCEADTFAGPEYPFQPMNFEQMAAGKA